MVKNTNIVIRVTEKQKDFLHQQADKEDRTITAIINVALGEKYPEYKEITKRKEDQ